MNLLEMMMSANGGQNIEALAQKFGITPDQVESVLGHAVPALANGAQNTISQEGGLGGMLGGVISGSHAQYADDPSHPDASAAGNEVLGQLLGGGATSDLENRIASSTGLSSTMIQSMLPVVASMAMGALSRHMSTGAGANQDSQTGLGGMLGGALEGGSMSGVVGMLGKLFTH